MDSQRKAGRTDDDDHDDDVQYFTLDQLTRYSGLSRSTLRRFLTDPEHPLPHRSIVPTGKTRGRILVPRRAFDAWVAGFPSTAPRQPRAGAAPDAPVDVSWVRRAFRKD